MVTFVIQNAGSYSNEGDEVLYAEVTTEGITFSTGFLGDRTVRGIATLSGSDVTSENPEGILYLYLDNDTDGGLRFRQPGQNADAVFEKRTSGVWEPASLELSTGSLALGPRVRVSAFGKWTATQDVDTPGEYHLHCFSRFDGETSIDDIKLVDAYAYQADFPQQTDDTGQFTGTSLSWIDVATATVAIRAATLKTGTTAATEPVRIQIYRGTDATGFLIFDQTYPASSFPVSSTIKLTANGWQELDIGESYFTIISSDADFSLLTNAAATIPYTLTDASFIRIDDMWQVRSYESRADGVYSFTAGTDYTIQDKIPYVCNTTGTQTGTFASNAALWDALGGESEGDVTGPASSIDDHIATFDGTTGKVLQNNGVGIFRSPNSVSLAELILQDSGGNNKLLIQHSDSLDINTINSTENMTVETSGTGAQLTLEAADGAVVVRAFSDDRVEFSSGASSSLGGFQFAQTGVSGSTATVAVIAGATPEGLTTASPGSLALSTTGVLYIKESGIGNTGWAAFGTGSVSFSNTPIDNAMVIADGTSGDDVQAFNSIIARSIANQNRLEITSGSTAGGVFIYNTSAAQVGSFGYNELSDQVAITTNSGFPLSITPQSSLEIAATGTVDLTGTNVTIEADGGATTGRMTFVTNEIQTLQSGWLFRNEVASGADVGLSVQSNDPSGANNGTPGDIIFRADLLDSDIYVKQTAADTTSTSGWRGVFATIDAVTAQNTAFAAINRTTATTVTQTISSNQSDWYPFTGINNNVESTTGFLTADQANNRVNVASVSDNTNGDLYEVSLTLSASAQSNTDINYRIAVYNNNVAQNTTENLLLRGVHNDGSNFINPINLSGTVRGPTGATNSYFRPEFQRTTGSTNYFHLTSAIYFSVRRIG